MKKIYLIPSISALQMQVEELLVGSGVTSNNGIGYGGVDTEGEKDPSVKENPFGDSIFGN